MESIRTWMADHPLILLPAAMGALLWARVLIASSKREEWRQRNPRAAAVVALALAVFPDLDTAIRILLGLLGARLVPGFAAVAEAIARDGAERPTPPSDRGQQ